MEKAWRSAILSKGKIQTPVEERNTSFSRSVVGLQNKKVTSTMGAGLSL